MKRYIKEDPVTYWTSEFATDNQTSGISYLQRRAFGVLISRIADRYINSFKDYLLNETHTLTGLKHRIQGYFEQTGLSIDSWEEKWKRKDFSAVGIDEETTNFITVFVSSGRAANPWQYEFKFKENPLLYGYAWLYVLDWLNSLLENKNKKGKKGRGNPNFIPWEPPIGFYKEAEKLKVEYPQRPLSYYIRLLIKTFDLPENKEGSVRRRLNESRIF